MAASLDQGTRFSEHVVHFVVHRASLLADVRGVSKPLLIFKEDTFFIPAWSARPTQPAARPHQHQPIAAVGTGYT